MILRIAVDDCHKFFNLFVIQGNLHTLSAKYIGRTYQDRISQTVCNLFRFFRCKDGSTGCSWDFCFL